MPPLPPLTSLPCILLHKRMIPACKNQPSTRDTLLPGSKLCLWECIPSYGMTQLWCECCRLHLRSLLMPQIVNQVAAIEDSRGKPIQLKSWAVAPELFPCQLSPDTLSQAKEVKHISG